MVFLVQSHNVRLDMDSLKAKTGQVISGFRVEWRIFKYGSTLKYVRLEIPIKSYCLIWDGIEVRDGQ